MVEALALENHLIKQRAPRYNILLRDDKNYPYLQLTTGEAFPRVLIARRVERDDHFYAGPFMPAKLARRTMALTHRLFGIRSCNEVITGERARRASSRHPPVHRAVRARRSAATDLRRRGAGHRLFLEGRNDELIGDLRTDGPRPPPRSASSRRRSCATPSARSRRCAIGSRRWRPGLGDRDAFGMKDRPGRRGREVFQVRGGKVVDRVELAEARPRRDAADPPSEVRGRSDAASATGDPPGGIGAVLSAARAAGDPPAGGRSRRRRTIEAWLTDRPEHRVRIVVPKRGEKRGLLDLAAAMRRSRIRRVSTNGRGALRRARNAARRAAPAGDAAPHRVLRHLDDPGRRNRGLDGGVRGRPDEAFRIPESSASGTRSPAAPRTSVGRGCLRRSTSDFGPRTPASSTTSRRCRKSCCAAIAKSSNGGPFPDLILIDGGKGQLSAAYAALESLGLSNLVAVGIAKKEELLFTREHVDPIALAPASPALLLIQRIRDEAHRFAMTFHRQSRPKRDLRSALDDIAGIGPRRRKALLTAFGSVAGVRRATREELIAVVGAKCADQVLAYFAGQP